jgi:UDP-2,3-diacylglucosamine hydrolase
LWVFDYLPAELGVIVHRDEIIKEIRGKKFFLAHGDGLDAEDVGYIRLKKIFTNKKLQWWYSRLHPNFALYIAHKWSGSSRTEKLKKKEEEFNVNNDGMYKFALSYLKREPIDYFIFGHRHIMVNSPINEKTRFVLLGDWIKNFSYGVFDGEKFELKRYKE